LIPYVSKYINQSYWRILQQLHYFFKVSQEPLEWDGRLVRFEYCITLPIFWKAFPASTIHCYIVLITLLFHPIHRFEVTSVSSFDLFTILGWRNRRHFYDGECHQFWRSYFLCWIQSMSSIYSSTISTADYCRLRMHFTLFIFVVRILNKNKHYIMRAHHARNRM